MKSRRSPNLAATPVLSPGIARAAVWVGLGAVARSRGIGWRPGIAGFENHALTRIKLKIPKITMLTIAFDSYHLTRVTKSYLLALGTTQISSYFTKH